MYFSDDFRNSFSENCPDVVYPIHISDLVLSASGIVSTIIIMVQHIRYRVRKRSKQKKEETVTLTINFL